MRNVSVTVFCSCKGGVGKSTLSVAWAKALAPRGGTVLLDFDMTGSSLADGLRLEAPRLATRADGRLALGSNRASWLDRAATLSAVGARQLDLLDRKAAGPFRVPFVNDLLNCELGGPGGPRFEQLLWREAGSADGLGILPSSAVPEDVGYALGHLYEGAGQLVMRLLGIVEGLLTRMADLEHIVIDTPPGLFGFTRAALSAAVRLGGRHDLTEVAGLDVAWDARTFLVTSHDHNDLVACGYALGRYRGRLLPLLNRATDRKSARDFFERRFSFGVAPGTMRFVSSYPESLGRIFLDERLVLSEPLIAELQETLGD